MSERLVGKETAVLPPVPFLERIFRFHKSLRDKIVRAFFSFSIQCSVRVEPKVVNWSVNHIFLILRVQRYKMCMKYANILC